MVVDFCVVVLGCITAKIVCWAISRMSKKRKKPETVVYQVFPKSYPKFWRIVDDDSIEQLHEMMKQFDQFE